MGVLKTMGDFFFNQGLFSRAGRGAVRSPFSFLFPTPADSPEENDSIIGNSAWAHAEKQSRARGVMDLADFDQRFRAANSPAREILSDIFTGMGAKLLGSRFTPLRQKLYEQEMEQIKLQQSQEKMDNLVQVAQQREQLARDLAAERTATQEAKRLQDWRVALIRDNRSAEGQEIQRELLDMKDEELGARLPLIQAQTDLAKKRAEVMGVDLGGHPYEIAYNSLLRAGRTEDEPTFAADVMALSKKIPQEKTGMMPRYQLKQDIDTEGKTVRRIFNPASGTLLDMPGEEGVSRAPEIRGVDNISRVRGLSDAVVQTHDMLSHITKNVKSVGIKNILDPQLRAVLGAPDPEALYATFQSRRGLMTELRALASSRASDQDMKKVDQMRPQTWTTPEMYIEGLLTVLEASYTTFGGLQTGLTHLSTQEEFDEIRKLFREAPEQSLSALPQLSSYETVIKKALKRKGFTPIYNQNGTMSGARRIK